MKTLKIAFVIIFILFCVSHFFAEHTNYNFWIIIHLFYIGLFIAYNQ